MIRFIVTMLCCMVLLYEMYAIAGLLLQLCWTAMLYIYGSIKLSRMMNTGRFRSYFAPDWQCMELYYRIGYRIYRRIRYQRIACLIRDLLVYTMLWPIFICTEYIRHTIRYHKAIEERSRLEREYKKGYPKISNEELEETDLHDQVWFGQRMVVGIRIEKS